jgi:hypothetical protein
MPYATWLDRWNLPSDPCKDIEINAPEHLKYLVTTSNTARIEAEVQDIRNSPVGVVKPNLTKIGIALTSAIHKLGSLQKGSRRICIDLVSDVLLQHHAVQTRRWLASLVPELKSAGFTLLAVIDPKIHPPDELHAILGLFEGEISINEKETEKGPVKLLKIKKMSNCRYLEDGLPLKKEHL